MHKLGLLGRRAPDLSKWRTMVERIMHPHGRVKIAVIGKYTGLVDSYKSVQEALIHGGVGNEVRGDIHLLARGPLFKTGRNGRPFAGFFRRLRPRGVWGG